MSFKFVRSQIQIFCVDRLTLHLTLSFRGLPLNVSLFQWYFLSWSTIFRSKRIDYVLYFSWNIFNLSNAKSGKLIIPGCYHCCNILPQVYTYNSIYCFNLLSLWHWFMRLSLFYFYKLLLFLVLYYWGTCTYSSLIIIR